MALWLVTVSAGFAYGAGDTAAKLGEEIEDLKSAVLELNRDLLILEEELLYPSNTQLAVFLSLDVGTWFQLDAVRLMVDDDMVASTLYTAKQVSALHRGGVQRLYLGNLKSGEHEITAVYTGKGPNGRDYKRGATLVINKTDSAKLLELRIQDKTSNEQPHFDIKEWQQ